MHGFQARSGFTPPPAAGAGGNAGGGAGPARPAYGAGGAGAGAGGPGAAPPAPPLRAAPPPLAVKRQAPDARSPLPPQLKPALYNP